ncbi:MAG: hypothetical protein AB7I30_05710 [Isosphaeraceae bacterium]
MRSAARFPSHRSSRRRHLPFAESLESREVMSTIPYGAPFTEMSQVSNQFAPPDAPTILYLNFDGRSSQYVSAFQGTTNSVTRDIQEILFRTAQAFAPFNVQVKRAYGDDTIGAGQRATTLFIGDKMGNTSVYDDPAGGMYVENFTRAYANADYPSLGKGILHVPNSDAFNVGYVDPYSYSGPAANYDPSNFSSWSNGSIARAAVHEAAHTFGLAHVLTSGQADVMSYDGGLNTYFRNKSYTTTNLNSVPGGGPAVPTPSLQPYWAYFQQVGNAWILTPSPIVTQNSYATLMANLGPRAVDGFANVADTGTVDPIYVDGTLTNVALGGSKLGTISAADHDVFTFNVGATQFVEVTIDPTGTGTLDPVLLVMSDSGKTLAFYDDDSGPGHASRLVFKALAGTTYHLVAAGYDGNSTGTYRIAAKTATFQINPTNLPGGFAIPSKNPAAQPPGSGLLMIVPLQSTEDGLTADFRNLDDPPFPTRPPGFVRRTANRR